MAVQLVPDSALSLLMVSVLGEEVGPRRLHSSLPQPGGTAANTEAAARAADMESTALLHPAGSCERISWVRGLA